MNVHHNRKRKFLNQKVILWNVILYRKSININTIENRKFNNVKLDFLRKFELIEKHIYPQTKFKTKNF